MKYQQFVKMHKGKDLKEIGQLWTRYKAGEYTPEGPIPEVKPLGQPKKAKIEEVEVEQPQKKNIEESKIKEEKKMFKKKNKHKEDVQPDEGDADLAQVGAISNEEIENIKKFRKVKELTERGENMAIYDGYIEIQVIVNKGTGENKFLNLHSQLLNDPQVQVRDYKLYPTSKRNRLSELRARSEKIQEEIRILEDDLKEIPCNYIITNKDKKDDGAYY